ncbi:MAG: LuxR C-terminal-related transcriptional regulator, partial [Chloroflexota bacterium]
SNILLDEEGNAFLSDFGIAIDLARPKEYARPPESLDDSLDYLSPEQARGQEVTPRTDLYSLGVILYEALTGQHPFPGLSSVERLYKHIEEPLPPIETLDPTISEGINKVIQKATAKDPRKRYSQALEMAADLREAASLGENGDRPVLEETLTQREQEILAYIVEGYTNKQIARSLFIELPTVKWHITHLYRKMGVRSRMQAIVRARELQLIPSEQEETTGEAGITDSVSTKAAFPLTRPINPYKGLRPFEAADSRDFFGREALIEELIDRLQEMDERARFLAVIGPSGSGKSSLLSAGLVPAIWAGKLPSSERWFVVEMAPGSRPLDELEVALTRIAAEQASNLHTHLNRDANGLLRAASLILPNDDSELFLIVDQFEELFVLIEDEPVRNHFLNLLYKAVTDPHSRVRVVIAMRADFYDKPLQVPEFGELVRGRMETVLPLSAEELERAIIQPAGQVDVTFEPGLPARIIEELLYQPGALPLLQYALTELFEVREGRVLTQEAYLDIGGAVGALARRAEEVYVGFGDEAREATRQMFLRLVNLGDGLSDGARAPDTRKRVARSELLALVEDSDLMDEVIDTFGAFRMLSLDHEAVSRQPIVELAHEALIGEWQRLEAWLGESREDLHQYRRFHALANEWDRSGRDPGYLLRESRLDQFASWAAGTGLALTPDEHAYLEASVQSRESRQEEEEERRQRELETARRLAATEKLHAEEQMRTNRRLRWLAASLVIFFLVAVGAALFARVESGRAEAQARLAFARELAAEAVGNLATDPELSIHLALQAIQSTYERDGFALPIAEEALHRAIQASRVNFTLPHSGGLAFSPDGLYLVTGGSDGSVIVWDASSGQHLRSITGHTSAVTSVAFSQDGSHLATASADHHRIVWDFATRRPVLNLPGTEETTPAQVLSKVIFSPDGEFLLSTGQFEEARVWDVASGREILYFEDSAGPTASFSPDGHKLALMTAVWDISDTLGISTTTKNGEADSVDDPAIIAWSDRLFDYGDPFIEFVAPSSEINSVFHEPGSVSYSPDGSRLLTTVISSVAVMRDAATGETLFSLTGHSSIINDTAFGPNGEMLATAGADGTARVWGAGSGQQLLVLEGHGDEVVQVAFSPNGQSLATSSLDGTTKMWDISPGGRGEWLSPMKHRGSVIVAFNPHSPHLLTVGQDGVVNLNNVPTGKQIANLGRFIKTNPNGADDSVIVWNADPAFSPDGTLLALAGEKGAIHLFEASVGEWLRSYQLGRAVSVMTFSPSGEWLFTGSEDGVLSILEVDTGEVLAEWLVQDGFVNGLAFNHDGTTLAIAGADGDIIVADLDRILSDLQPVGSAKFRRRLPEKAILTFMTGHTDVIAHLEPNPDGTRYLTASWDGTARVWDVASGDLLLTLAGHQGRVWHAAFTPDGRRIATAGADGSLILWDAGSGEQLFVLIPQLGELLSLAFSSDGKYLAASGGDGSVRIYMMPVEELMALAQDRLTRDLTEEECRRYLHMERCPKIGVD